MKALKVIAIFGGLCATAPVFAQALWYNGDINSNSDIIVDQQNFALNTEYPASIFDDFNVGGNGWNISSLFENVIAATGDIPYINSFTWQIRQGVSSGNGGTLVATGTSSVSISSTGRTFYGQGPFGETSTPEYQVLATGINVNLQPGTYWLGGTLGLTAAAGTYFVGTTSGANAVGTPAGNDNTSFYESTALGYNWVSEGADYSMGVNGTALPAPEPASMAALAVGAVALIRRKRSAR